LGGSTHPKLAPLAHKKERTRVEGTSFRSVNSFWGSQATNASVSAFARQDRYFLTRSTISSRILPVHLIITLLDIVTTIWRITKNANPD